MSKLCHFATGLALSTLIPASAALADVTPAQVWENWQQHVLATRPDMLTTGSATMAGDTLTVPDVALRMEQDGMTFSVPIGTMTFTQHSDGTVSVGMPDSYPLTIAEGDTTTVEATITHTGMMITASGDPDAISYDVTADQYAIVVDRMAAIDDMAIPGDVRATLTDISGSYRVATGEMRRISYAVSAGSGDLLVDIRDAATDSTLRANGRLDAPYLDARLVVPDGLTAEASQQSLAAGLDVSTRFGLAGGSYDFDLQDGANRGAGVIRTGAVATDMALNSDAMLLSIAADDLDFDATLPGNMRPTTLSLAALAVNLALPLAKADTPADFALGLVLSDLGLGPEFWRIGDPGDVLPHDPLTLRLDLAGTARPLVDMAQVTPFMMGQPPAELHSLDLRELAVIALGASVSGKGSFTFDNNDLTTIPGMPRPEGSATFDLTGVNGLIDNLMTMGLLGADQAMMGRMMLGMFARSTGDDQLTSTIEVDSAGQVLANGQRIR